MKRGRLQAKDIADARVLAIVSSVGDQRRRAEGGGGVTFTDDVQGNLPEFHPKVVLAKLDSLVRRRLLSGCACGCSGSFKLTASGEDALVASGVKINARWKRWMENEFTEGV